MPGLELVLSIDGPAAGAEDFHGELARAAPDFTPVDTAADDPALMVYTSGTTGPPKGALHAHRVLLGHLPGIEFPHEFLPQPGDRFWTPADWAWAGGLLNVLLPGLHYGVPVVAQEIREVRSGGGLRAHGEDGGAQYLHPADGAAHAARGAEAEASSTPAAHHRLGRRVARGRGLRMGQVALGLTINEFYGQTECNLVFGSCAAIGVSRAGRHRQAGAGPHRGDDPPGRLGMRARRARPDRDQAAGPSDVPGVLGQARSDARKVHRRLDGTGDQGMVDADGYVHFVGRDDDVITSSGYRIGPTEIEDCLIKHPAVALAAVVGKPDPVRTEIVKAFVVPNAGHAPSDTLAADIQSFVKSRLSAHEYPREVAFIEQMPMTTTGKVIRRLLRQQA